MCSAYAVPVLHATSCCLQAAVQKQTAAAAAKPKSKLVGLGSHNAASIRWWEGISSIGISSGSSWVDYGLMMALSVAGDKLNADSGDAKAAAAAAADIVCSSISAAAASGYRPSDRWLQQAWQLLQQALGIAAGCGALPDKLAEAEMRAAYETAVTFGFSQRRGVRDNAEHPLPTTWLLPIWQC
jgi:hypothetical protein